MNPIHTGIVTQGKLKLDSPARYLVTLARHEGKLVELVLRRRRSQRSLNQNAAYWGIAVEILSEHTGFDKETMHEALKEKFASHRDEKTGLLIVESTAKMDTKRFCKYYEDIQHWAIEFLGVRIPDPNEVDYAEAVR